MRSTKLVAIKLGALLLASCTTVPFAYAERDVVDRGCELTVEGRVVRLYKSDDRTQLVELQLRSVALENDVSSARGARIPAPGETVYVIVSPARERPRPSRSFETNLPPVGASIRALLRQGEAGTWTGEGEWFASLAGAVSDDASDRQYKPGAATVEVLGMSCEAKLVGGQLGLEVKRVQRSGPASQAGFQPGDVVVAVNGRPLSSAADLASASEGGESIELTVVDVNSGRLAKVNVTPSVQAETEKPSLPGESKTAKVSPAERITTSLGISVQPTRIGLEKAVNVSKVAPQSPGAEAGLEVGDVIVQVGGKRVSSAEDFAELLPRRPGLLTLVVRDVRTGREVPIEVNSAGLLVRASEPRSASLERSPVSQSPRQLGIAGELAFYEAEAAVKVVRVTPGSAADRAGVRPGMILRSADGQALLHPDDLEEIAKNAKGSLTFRGVDPTTRRESSLRIEL